MRSVKRLFLIVLDSMGIGEAPDAYIYNDEGSNTLGAIRNHPDFDCPNLAKLGLFNIEGVGGGVREPAAAYARMREASMGKDTTIGHWEIAGIISPEPLPTYPDGFPAEILDEFEKQTGRGVLCNKPYSGTDVIRDYGQEHVRTGKLIVYTSADSVFQIAAHEDVVPVEELYKYCEIARRILVGRHGVGRVIARPFTGDHPYTRTPHRHDFSLSPPAQTMLDVLSVHGFDTVSVGKINDVFAARGISESKPTQNNVHGMQVTEKMLEKDFTGICFVNLVDFDMIYGHRNDVAGYAAAMTEFDRWLGGFIRKMNNDDVLLITADHGCDPSTKSTNHSREYTPMLLYGKNIRPVNLGTRSTFADISATVLDMFGLQPEQTKGESFLGLCKKQATDDKSLILEALRARDNAYTPYSHFKVGAALLTKSGKIYSGCNIENAAFGPSVCAERTAIFKAVSDGERDFVSIAIVGGKENAELSSSCAPCGVCRQVMREFCDDDLRVILGTPENYTVYSLYQLLPLSFSAKDLESK